MGMVIENTFAELIYGLIFIFWAIYVYFVKDYGYWEERGVPHVPPVFPFGSTVRNVWNRCYRGITYDQIYRDFRDERFVGLIDIRNPSLLVRDPELIGHILEKDFSNFTDHTMVDPNPAEYLLNHLYNLKGQEWRDMRHKLAPAYTAAKVKMMFCLVQRCSADLRKAFTKLTSNNSVVNVKDCMSRFTMDVIATCVYGVEINSLENVDSEFCLMGRKSNEVSVVMLLKMYLMNAFPIFKKIHCFNYMDSDVTEFFTRTIRSAVEYRESQSVERFDFLDLLIKLRRSQSILEEGEKSPDLPGSSTLRKREGLTIEEITAQTFAFFAAGYETTANTIMFCLYELACDNRIQDKLSWEVKEVLGRHGGDISYQALQEMSYMEQVIKESLRRYPILPYLTRTCSGNYKLPNSNVEIKTGHQVVIPVYSLHHDPNYFPEPFTFNPERFSHSNNLHPHVYLPFGEGPRMCIGKQFGLTSVKTALASLVSDYKISLAPDTDVPLKLKNNPFTTLPSKPLMLVFTRRNATVL
ncbi:hypothetical protein J6590_037502 [Homalodisca vitripennis]|nr:hypothetical protein J6590_037502 [Homalodisca vitripennis]